MDYTASSFRPIPADSEEFWSGATVASAISTRICLVHPIRATIGSGGVQESIFVVVEGGSCYLSSFHQITWIYLVEVRWNSKRLNISEYYSSMTIVTHDYTLILKECVRVM